MKLLLLLAGTAACPAFAQNIAPYLTPGSLKVGTNCNVSDSYYLSPFSGNCFLNGGGGGGSGTVTSVAFTAPAWLTVTGSPITVSGTIALASASLTANYFLAAPNGAAGALSPRAIVLADLPASLFTLTTTGTSGAATYSGGTLNIPQYAGSGGITALTGDVTASGSGSVAATLATVNSNVGSFGSSSAVPVITVNGKGLITAVSTAANPQGTVTTVGGSTSGGFIVSTSSPTTTPAVSVAVDSTHVLPTNTGSATAYLNGAGSYTTPAGGPTLQTNGTNNASQTALNLIAGTNITLANSGANVTITASSTGATAFSALTGSTNTSAAMVVGSGASLAASGTGTITPTTVNGLLAAGTNVTLTGSGTAASPYTIASSGGGGGITGPGTTTTGYAPLWSNTTGTALGAGLLVATTGNSTILETTGAGVISVNTTGTAANLTAAAALPNGTTATTQTAGDTTTKLATDAFVSSLVSGYLPLTGGTLTGALTLPSATFTGSSNGAVNLTYTGTAATGPGTNTVLLSPTQAITTPYTMSYAAAPYTGLTYWTNTSNTMVPSQATAANLQSTLGPTIYGVNYVSGYTAALGYAGVGAAQVAYTSGPSYGVCQNVSYSGSNYIAVNATNGSVTPGTNSAVWYPIPSAATGAATSYDCAMAMSITNSLGSMVLGNNAYSTPYDTCLGIPEPATGLQVSIIGQGPGFNRQPTEIRAICAMQAPISHAALTSGSAPYGIVIKDVAIDGNGYAQQCIALYSEKKGYREHITCRGAISASLPWIEWGASSPPGGYVSGYGNYTNDIYLAGTGNGPSSWATLTATQTSGVPSISGSGGTYANANPPAYLYGFQQASSGASTSTVQPCTTMGTATANMTGTGPYSVSSVTLSGYSGCSGYLFAYVPDISSTSAPIGISENETDSFFGLEEVNNVGVNTGISYNSGSNRIVGDHAYGGMQSTFTNNNPQSLIAGLEVDTPMHIGITDNTSGKGIYTSTSFITPLNGVLGWLGTAQIQGSHCGGATASTNYFNLLGTSSGVVAHGTTFNVSYPAQVTDAEQCDNLAVVNYIPSMTINGLYGNGYSVNSSGTGSWSGFTTTPNISNATSGNPLYTTSWNNAAKVYDGTGSETVNFGCAQNVTGAGTSTFTTQMKCNPATFTGSALGTSQGWYFASALQANSLTTGQNGFLNSGGFMTLGIAPSTLTAATTLAPGNFSQFVYVSGSASIEYITPPTSCVTVGQGCTETFVPTTGSTWGFITGGSGTLTGAIAQQFTPVVGQAYTATFDPNTNLWNFAGAVPTTAGVTTSQCLGATSVSSPCLAYDSGAQSGLSATYAGSTTTLTSSASAGVYQFCPNFYQDSGTGSVAGSAVIDVTWTTPGGFANSATQMESLGFTVSSGYNWNSNCFSVATGSGATLSTIVKAISGTGTVSWEYRLTVERLR